MSVTSGNRRAALPSPPPPSAEWAYFLDFDGTLVELAERPETATTDDDVRAIVAALTQASGGAVALISGRTIADLVARFGAGVPVAGQHGAERLATDGRLFAAPTPDAALDPARDFLRHALAAYPALLLEDKGRSLALHYRASPRLAGFAHHVMKAAHARVASAFSVSRGKCVVELRSSRQDKGDAIAAFMAEPPFARRCPVFIGDDRTDEAGFAYVNAQHGISVKVGPGSTSARYRLSDVRAVRRWLRQAATPHAPQYLQPATHADA
jgi:trehalose 6-phosphate phosphatase